MKKYILVIIFSIAYQLSFSQSGNQFKLKLFMQPTSEIYNAISYGNNPAAGKYVQSDDAKIYYEVYGKGQPFVILHGGIAGSSYDMGRFIDSLSQKYQVIAISTRGHGKSEMGFVAPGYEQKAKDVNAVLSAVSKEKAIVLGFSDGGYTGYFFAKAYPDKIEKLITIGAGEWKKGGRTFNLSRKTFFAYDEEFWSQQMKMRPEPNRIDEWFESMNLYFNNLKVGKSVFENVKCPVLLMAGEKDQNAPLETIINAYHELPNAELAIIANAPHSAFFVNFDAVWANIGPFLKK